MSRPRSGPSRWSLRHRIVAIVIGSACLVWAILFAIVQHEVTRSSARELDERLAFQARLILAYGEHEYAETGSVLAESDAPVDGMRPEAVYQVWTGEHVALWRSPGAPASPLYPADGDGLRDVRIDGVGWRVCALHSTKFPLRVQVGEPSRHLEVIAARAREAVLLPMLLALPILAFLVWVLVGAAFRTVERLASDLRRREPQDLTPVNTSGLPAETLPLGEELNRLIVAQAGVLARERQFTADAAHELRTPLAALRTQAQVAARSQTLAEARVALQKLMAGVDRTTRLIGQLLSLARLEPTHQGTTLRPRALAEVLTGVVQDLATECATKALSVEVTQGAPTVAFSEEAIYLLLRNLLENAIKHSSQGATIRVTTAAADDGATQLCITDQGPGIPVESRARVFERFHRLPGSPGGSGLGLAIVRRVVEMLDGRIELADSPTPPGLLVRVTLPARAELRPPAAPASVLP